MVGAKGFEPSTSWSRTRRASQAALRPDKSTQTLKNLSEYIAYHGSCARGTAIHKGNAIEEKAAARLLFSIGPVRRETTASSELVAQRELHHARIG